MDKINRNIVGVFKRALNNLQYSKTKDINQRDHLILELKSLAFEGLSYRDEIVGAIRAQADIVDIKSNMLIIKLILAIVSANNGEYKGFFDEHIVDIFLSSYANGDDITKTELFDMREKWNPYFSKNTLIELDNTVRKVDKRWLNFSEKPVQLGFHKEKIALLNEIERLKKDRDLARAQMEKRRQNVVITTTPRELPVAKPNPVKEEQKAVGPVIHGKPQPAIVTVPTLNMLKNDLWLSDDSETEDEPHAMKPLEVQPSKKFIQQSPVNEQVPAPMIPSKPEENQMEESSDESSSDSDSDDDSSSDDSSSDDSSSDDSSSDSESESEEPQAVMHIPNPIPKGMPIIENGPKISINSLEPKVSQTMNGSSQNTSMPGVKKYSHAIVNPSRYRPKEINFFIENPIKKRMKRPNATVKDSKLKESQIIRKSPVNKVSTGVENEPQATTSKPNAEIRKERHLKRKRDQENRQAIESTQKSEEIDLSGAHFEPPRKVRRSPNDVWNSTTPPDDDDETSGGGSAIWDI